MVVPTIVTADLSGARWRKSSHSSATSGGNSECVEVTWSGPVAAVRDSKSALGPVLTVPSAAFLRSTR